MIKIANVNEWMGAAPDSGFKLFGFLLSSIFYLLSSGFSSSVFLPLAGYFNLTLKT